MTPDERAALKRLLDVCNLIVRNGQFRIRGVAVIEDILRDLRIVHQMINRMEALDGRSRSRKDMLQIRGARRRVD